MKKQNLTGQAVMTIATPVNINAENVREDLFARYLSFLDRSKLTEKAYLDSLKRFWKYLQAEGITQPTRDTILAYRDEMKTQGLSPATIKLRLNSVKSFFSWLSAENLYPNIGCNVRMPNIQNEERTPHKRAALTIEDVQKILATMPSDDSEKSLRDRCLILLAVSCGLRRCELARLQVGDVQIKSGKFFLNVLGKGKSDKTLVPLPFAIFQEIQKYWAVRKLRGKFGKKAPMFVSTSRRNRNQNCKMDEGTLSRLARKIMDAAGFTSELGFSLHSARHGYATISLQFVKKGEKDAEGNFLTLKSIQFVMRHSSQKTTERYLHSEEILANTTCDLVANSILMTA